MRTSGRAGAVADEFVLSRSVEMWTKMNFARDDITFIIVKIGQP